MMIVFVYDTARCCKEEDDPADAVLYFHPAWVSPTQRLALAGQLMGVNQFLETSFSSPHAISLQGGKFVLKKFGQYILAVGTDRNIHDWILERRADTLESMLKFFHCDLSRISESFNNDRNKFTEKLYQMFETYLPILRYSANLFSNIPVIKLPKSASNIFLEAIQVLQHCQEITGVMGGAMFYNNKVVATQLNAELTKQIVITDPYRIKAPADRVPTEFHLPVGVQLLRVYVEQKQFMKLLQEANNERYYSNYLDSVAKKMSQRKSISKSSVKEPQISGMKRDTSRIFTVPEEAELESMPFSTAFVESSAPPPVYNSPIKRKQESKTERTITTNKYVPTNPTTPSVCSTPLKDLNRVLHGTAMSICSAADELDERKENVEEEPKVEVQQDMDDIPDVVKEALRCKRLKKIRNAPSREKVLRSKDRIRKSLSTSDISNGKCTNRIFLSSGNGWKENGTDALDSLDSREEVYSAAKKCTKRVFRTITDPYYPVFRYDGLAVSRSLYEEYIATQYQELNMETESGKGIENRTNDLFMTNESDRIGWAETSAVTTITNTTATTTTSINSTVVNKESAEGSTGVVGAIDKCKQETYRRSMSLPLKPLNVNDDDRRKSECNNVYDFLQRRKLDGLQLTPLMSKLSLLADEKTSGFCSRETTPSEFRDLSSFSAATNQLLKQKLEAVHKDEICSEGEDELDEDWVTAPKKDVCLEKTELFLCGHRNMVLVLLMESGTANNPDLVHSLWQTCVNTLGKLETRLQQCLDPIPTNENKELYSILSVDPQWDTVHRSGLWGVTELDIVSCLHDRFTRATNLTDIVVRTDDTVVYGNQCGKIEVFYQQAVSPNAIGGLPTPADLMGTISLKAKRRLERDHAILLL